MLSRRGVSSVLPRAVSTVHLDAAAAAAGDGAARGELSLSSSWTVLTEPPGAHAERVRRTFRELAVQGVLGRERCLEALRRMGHREPDAELVASVAEVVTLSWHLDVEDMLLLAVKYREAYCRRLEESLGRGLLDEGSAPAAVDFESVGDSFFATVQTQVAPGVKTQLLRTMGLARGGRSITKMATAEEVMRMRDLIIDHSGFTPTEHKRVKATFARYDHDKDGLLCAKDLRLALSWLGASPRFARQATEGLSGGKEDAVGEDAFVEIVKSFFKHEEARIRGAMEEADRDGDGLVNRAELVTFFERLGFVIANRQVLSEALSDCHLDQKPMLDYEDLFQVFMRFREASGFTKAELAEVIEAFDNFDKDQSAGLSAAELEVAMQWLGYPTRFEVVRRFLLEHDIDDSGEVELDEFAGFVAKYRDLHFTEVKRCFRKYGVECDSGGLEFPTERLHQLLLECGYVVTKAVADGMAAKAGASRMPFWKLADLVMELRYNVREKARRNHCFSDGEVRRLREQFDRWSEGEGCIRGRRLAALIEELYPGVQQSPELHARARRLVETADANGDTSIDFDEFLGMMRTFHFEQRLDEIRKEKDAIAKTSFTARERLEFRRVFDMFDEDASGDIDADELSTMLDGVVPPECLTSAVLSKLRVGLASGNRALSFCDFLVFMEELSKTTAAVRL